MKKVINKYFVLIWLVTVGVYNTLLFLLFNEYNKEALNKPAFWVLYGVMMFAFVAWLLIGNFEKNTSDGGIRPVATFVGPYVGLIFVITTIMFFFASKINVIWIIIPFILITALFLIIMIFASKNREMIKENPQRVKEIFSVEDLNAYFMGIAKIATNDTKEVVLSLSNLCAGLTSISGSTELDALEKRLFEYAALIKQNATRGEALNIYNNVDRFKKILKEREALVATL